jgi:hypothetical protein
MREFWEKKEVDGKEFYMIKMGRETHGKPSFILWVNPKLINPQKNYISFPINASLVKGTKDYILKPTNDPNKWVFDIFIECGFRGSSSFEILSPYTKKVYYWEYKSPRGNLGISKGALIETAENYVKIRFSKTGKTYGKPKSGIKIYKLDGSVEELPSDTLEDAYASLEGGEDYV